ncbi:MAG: site-2 protease family protein [Cetobacterium sp.]|uniref:M50 family metallopeptidase n=1 Tax=unclassified Cetobacterium TaxID=2630983 RepID=UPI00163C0FB7|nr:site-2 protease family protein [Cetobacterium sp. 2A]MBC2856368.1 site-2 protease family protein [Cetobacterium sp. 2A]
MNILIALLVLGIIIIIHELGHFLAARLFKMPISEFAIGMGPEIYSYYGGRTSYSLRAIPIGGYVNIDGMEVDSKVKNGFNSKTPFQRFVVLFAGVFMNFTLAYIAIFMMLLISGKAIQNHEPVIGEVMKQANITSVLEKGDKIKSIDGIEINKWEDIGKAVQDASKKTENPPIVIEREGKDLSINAPLTKAENDRYMLGIVPEYSIQKYGVIDAAGASFKMFGSMFKETLNGLKMLVTGKVKAKEISGPVGIVKIVGEVSKSGGLVMFWLIAILSVNVGIFNLLPFPALDGGRIIFVILEMVGIKVNKKLEEKFHMIGMFILFGLIIFATANDLFNLSH